MTNKQKITQAAVLFTGLTLGGILIALSARIVSDTFAQDILISFGSAMFCVGLTFFLMRMVSLTDNSSTSTNNRG